MSPDGLRARALALRAMRAALETRGFLEVPTPALVPSAAMERYLYPVVADGGLLRTSPEFALKRVVASGLGRIYEIGPCWRDREAGPWHRREFLMLEWYRVGGGITDLCDDVEAIVASVAAALGVAAPSWRRTDVRRLVNDAAGVDVATATASELSRRDTDWDLAFQRVWLERVEGALAGAVFVRDWPPSQAALARLRDTDVGPVADRVEAYLHGIELANGFVELIDGAEQARRFVAANDARAADGEPPHPLDPAFLAAVARMPPTAGMALGVERLVATLLGLAGLDDVVVA